MYNCVGYLERREKYVHVREQSWLVAYQLCSTSAALSDFTSFSSVLFVVLFSVTGV